MMRSPDSAAGDMEASNEIDLRALGAALKRRRRAFLLPTLLAFLLIAVYVNVASPRYTAETQVLLENQETYFTRPERSSAAPEASAQVDQEGVASQVQLVDSPDIARRAIKDLDLIGNREFDPSASPVTMLMVALGLAHDSSSDTVEARATQRFLEKLTVYSPPKTRVITIQFTSKDPDLAAKIANTVAELYIQEQSAAKRAMAKEAADSLAAQIADLRAKLASADAEREQYRLQSGLLAGSNNMTITGQQLADINSDLSKARSAQADAQAKASMIRQLLRSGTAADVPDVINNDIVRRIWDQRSTAEAQLALESRTLMPGHPRIKALEAQVAAYDATLKSAAKQAATSLENEAKIAGARVANLNTVLTQQKSEAGASNADEVHLRALERTTQSYKDQLESSSTKYQEALARQSSDATPADARIISRATRPEDASFPKKLPFIIFGTVATLFFSVGFVVASELLSGRADIEDDVIAQPEPVARPRTQPRSPSPQPATSAPIPRRSDVMRELTAPEESEPDLVFAPVEDEPRPRQMSSKPGLMAAAVDYLKDFGRSAAESRVFQEPTETPAKRSAPAARASIQEASAEPAWADDPWVGWEVDAPAHGVPPRSDAPRSEAPRSDTPRSDAATLSDRIVAAHVPGRGLHIVGTSLGNETGATAVLIELGRTLAGKGRSIIVDLNRAPMKLASLCDSGGDGRATVMVMNGLSELLAGSSSFAEAIHRDHGSRLHFIPSGRQEADFADFDLILDALSETYDFIMLLAPAFPQSEIAKVMAPYADFVVLTAQAEPDDKMLGMLERELVEAGAREVLVAGRPTKGKYVA